MSSRFEVVAIVAAYNEADVIEHVVRDLIQQGVQVYFLDDGSSDGTVGVIESYVGRGVLAIEQLATDASAGRPVFAWERILARKAQLASELDARWLIHHDADEFRESPWSGMSLADAIRRVDALGYNAIDFASLDFWPDHDRFRPGDDVRQAFRFYSERASYDRVQIRCWKQTNAAVDLVSSGGHDVQFPGRNIFPVRFVLRHYPIRGQAHGERKVFRERRARFVESERARGWHVQYDGIREGASFIRDRSTLTAYDADAIRVAVTIGHRGVEALESDLAGVRTEIDLLRRHVESLRRAAEQEALELQTRSRDLADAQRALDRALADREKCSDEALRLERAVADLHRVLADRDAESEQWRLAVEDQSRQLAAIRRSLSWRWTAPARAAVRLLRGK